MPIPIRTGVRALYLRRNPDAVIIHAEQSWYDTILAGKFDFYNKLEALLKRKGHKLYITRITNRASRLLRHGKGVQIMVCDRPKVGPRRLHAMPTHVWGFWHFDPKGIWEFSSITDAEFVPDQIDAAQATYFFNGVTSYMLNHNITRRAQSPRAEAPLPRAKAVMFVQHIDVFKRHRAYIPTLTMLRETLSACAPHKVYVKLHPRQDEQTIPDIRKLLAEFPHAEETTAGVHDLIAASEVVVVQNSSTGFEALMQRKPVVSCAACAFHKATVVVKDASELGKAVLDAPSRMADFPYEKYFYWFLNERCLEPAKPVFERRAWEILQRECGM